ncbi:hypothetical protein REPUB_Repub18cG0071200 [Reevesia pubescens]
MGIERNAEWLGRQGNALMVVAAMLATMAFQACVNPPSGIWQNTSPSDNSSSTADSNHKTGFSIWAYNHSSPYTSFLMSNIMAFLASLSIIIMLMSGVALRNRFFMWVLTVIMGIATIAIIVAYMMSITSFTPKGADFLLLEKMTIAVIVWIVLITLFITGYTIREIIRFINFIRTHPGVIHGNTIQLINAIETLINATGIRRAKRRA